MAKTKEVTDPNEALAKLGIDNPEIPGGEQVITIQEPPIRTSPEEKVQEPVKTDESVEQQALKLEGEEKVSSTQDSAGNLTEEEKQRRSWQAEADKAKAEKMRLESEIQKMQEQNRNLLNVVTPFMMKYGGGNGNQQSNVQEQTNEKPKPDYIVDGFYDAEKHADWQLKHDEWLLRNAESRISTNLQKRQEEQTTQQQLGEVAKEFPEYVNSLTGEVDTNRLYNDLQSYTGKKTMLDLLRESKGKKVETNPLVSDASISAIEKNANRPQSVADSQETESIKKEVPEGLKKTIKVFGNMDLPPDFDGLI